MNCRRIRKYISSDLDGELDAIEKQALLKHLEICSKCKQEYENLSSILNIIEPPVETPAPPYLFQSIREKIHSQEHQPIPLRWLKPVFVPVLLSVLFFTTLISSLLVRQITDKPEKIDSADLKLALNLSVFDDAPSTSFSDIYANLMTGE